MRRTAALLLAVVMLVGALIVGGGAFVVAQDATPVASAEHPLVGVWQVDPDIETPDNPLLLDTFSADGTYFEVEGEEGGVTVGVWEPTGDNAANLTSWFVDPEGTVIVRASIEVAPDGQAFTASYTLEFIAPDGTSTGEIGPGMAEGTKLAVEPQGDPVASFEEAFAPAPATPQATPAG